ncbi:MAG: hypothetical protein AVDCRST_MAG49-580, partial [uncultured Thermomicrobiales bacterium]
RAPGGEAGRRRPRPPGGARRAGTVPARGRGRGRALGGGGAAATPRIGGTV